MNRNAEEVRNLIICRGYRPDVRHWKGEHVWNGHSAVKASGNLTYCFGLLAQVLRRMLKQGQWPELGKVRVSWRRYWLAYDDDQRSTAITPRKAPAAIRLTTGRARKASK